MLVPGVWTARSAGSTEPLDDSRGSEASSDGYLLAYKRQYVVVDRYFIESLGLDPLDPDWEDLGFDWVRPKHVAARSRLYAKLVACQPREAAWTTRDV
ncbi:MAG: hypothetical protein JWO19_649 [Bryobacterales bacterium]|nr:hypothetical protein [Bryobacterales bacterium]